VNIKSVFVLSFILTDNWSKNIVEPITFNLYTKDLKGLLSTDESVYFVNIVGEVNIMEKDDVRYSQAYRYVYNREKIIFKALSAGGTHTEALIYFFVAFVIITLFLFAWFYRRYKLMQRRLKYEMQDIRNVAGMISFNQSSEQTASETQEDVKLIKN
jgi:hypothetical protein